MFPRSELKFLTDFKENRICWIHFKDGITICREGIMKKRKGTNNKRREKKKISKSYFILCSWRCFLPSNQSYILLPPTRDANISISFDYVKTDEINILSNLVTLQKRILILFKSNNLCTTKITILFSFQIFITSSPLFPQINSLFANSKNWRKNSFSWILRIFMKTLCLKKKKNLKVFLISLHRLNRNFLPFFPFL